MNHFWITLSTSFNEHFDFSHAHLYLSGIVVSGLVVFLALRKLKSHEKKIDLNQFYGHVYEHFRITFIFLISCLGLTGVSNTPTFIGEDLIFSHIHSEQYLLAMITATAFNIDVISVVRVYNLYPGPHVKTYHETTFKSS